MTGLINKHDSQAAGADNSPESAGKKHSLQLQEVWVLSKIPPVQPPLFVHPPG